MPKILQINVTANWGSTGKIEEQIGVCAMTHGWKSFVAYGRYSNPSKSVMVKVGTKFDTFVHYATQRIWDNEGLCSCRATRKLIEEIKQISPDVIQLHNIHDHYLNYELLFEFLNQSDIRVVWTFHDCWAFTGHCMHFVTKNCDRWKSGCHDCLMRGEYPKTLFDRSERNWFLKKDLFAKNKNLTIVACSQWIADFVKDSFFRGKNTIVINNGVDLNVFKPLNVEPRKGVKILAVSNVWHREKGLYDIFELREMLPNNYYITIVGLAPGQTKELPKGITGITRTQNVHELVRLYSEADVLINPTYADTFPTVNLEALACGTPVITYRTGGSPEAIDEKTGIVVEQGNVKALCDAVLQLKNNPLSSSDCRERAVALFDKDKCFEKYIALYNSLLSQNEE